MRNQHILAAYALATASMLFSEQAHAAVTLNFVEVGPDLVGTYSGSYLLPTSTLGTNGSDLSGYREISARRDDSSHFGTSDVGTWGPHGLQNSSPDTMSYHFPDPTFFYLGGGTEIGPSTNTLFRFEGDNAYFDSTTITGQTVTPTGFITLLNKSLTDLPVDLSSGPVLMASGNDQFFWSAAAAPIPEPTRALLLLGGLAGTFLLRRRKPRS